MRIDVEGDARPRVADDLADDRERDAGHDQQRDVAVAQVVRRAGRNPGDLAAAGHRKPQPLVGQAGKHPGGEVAILERDEVGEQAEDVAGEGHPTACRRCDPSCGHARHAGDRRASRYRPT